MATPKKKRAKGTGSVVKQASGNYAFQYKDSRGKRVTKSLKTKSRKEAISRAKEYERGLTARDTQDVLHEIARARELIDTRSLPMSEVWSAFLATKPTAGDGTLKLYRCALQDFENWLLKNRPSQSDFALITQEDAEDWLSAVWARGISASTYNDRRNSLSLIHKQLAKPYRLGSNPWTRTDRKKGVQQKRLPLSRDQITQLSELDSDPEIKALLYLGLFAGMRLGDAVSLKAEAISGRVITYTPAKTARTSGAVARVPIMPILWEALEPLVGERAKGEVFPTSRELYKRNPDGLNHRLLQLIHSVTGKGEQEKTAQAVRSRSLYGFHSLRHTFATEAARVGVGATMLQLMTGDSMQTLEKYYVQIGEIGIAPALGFDRLPSLLSPVGGQTAKREELKLLAENLPISAVKELLSVAKVKWPKT